MEGKERTEDNFKDMRIMERRISYLIGAKLKDTNRIARWNPETASGSKRLEQYLWNTPMERKRVSVIDTSVVIKWFIDEVDSEKAIRLREEYRVREREIVVLFWQISETENHIH